jgi:hypothetical protein
MDCNRRFEKGDKMKSGAEATALFCGWSNSHQRRTENTGGIAKLVFYDGRLQLVGENIFPHSGDAFGINGPEI